MHVPVIYYGVSFGGLIVQMLKCYIMIKKYVGSILLWLTASVKGAQMERKFINKNSNFCKKVVCYWKE